MNNNFIGTLLNKDRRPPFIWVWFGWTVYSILSIIENIIRLATFQLYMPDWSMNYIFWNAKYEATKYCKKL